ncbi:MAG: hypothetical protein RLZZ381_1259 [Cyanobacteriota bacterium]|jgi:hypothetical protein
MTELLRQAIAKVQNLPENEQDNIAAIILEELEDEAKWEESFTASQDLLASLASEAMQEYEAGETQELDPETII